MIKRIDDCDDCQRELAVKRAVKTAVDELGQFGIHTVEERAIARKIIGQAIARAAPGREDDPHLS